MKKLPVILLLLALGLTTFARQTAKNDVILKVNGEELSGKVLKINDDAIEFTYAGETLAYTIKKMDILKITYASGRIEIFNKQPLPSQTGGQQPASGGQKQAVSNLEDHHNKVAILPFSFIRDGQPTADGDEVQNEAYNFMSKHSGIFTILNPRITNAQLIKAGITKDNIKGYTMDDLCNILGVEYVVDCLITMNKTTQTVFQSNSGRTTTKEDDDKRDKRYNSSSYGTATQNYETNTTFAIYNDKGTTVYNQNRKSFWNTQDAYRNTLEYLLKRRPLYTK